MSRYIDADAADKLLESFIDSRQNAFSPTEYIAGLQRAKKIISVLPTADVQEVKHGKWIYIPETAYTVSVFECSACGCYRLERCTKREFRYCPTCGARMDSEEK